MLVRNLRCLRRGKGKNSPARARCQPIQWNSFAVVVPKPACHFLGVKRTVSWSELPIEQFGDFFCCAGFLNLVQCANNELIEPCVGIVRILGLIFHRRTSSHRLAVLQFYKQVVPIGWCKAATWRCVGILNSAAPAYSQLLLKSDRVRRSEHTKRTCKRFN